MWFRFTEFQITVGYVGYRLNCQWSVMSHLFFTWHVCAAYSDDSTPFCSPLTCRRSSLSSRLEHFPPTAGSIFWSRWCSRTGRTTRTSTASLTWCTTERGGAPPCTPAAPKPALSPVQPQVPLLWALISVHSHSSQRGAPPQKNSIWYVPSYHQNNWYFASRPNLPPVSAKHHLKWWCCWVVTLYFNHLNCQLNPISVSYFYGFLFCWEV